MRILLFLLVAVFAPLANAQTADSDFQRIMNTIIKSTPGVSSVVVGSGASAVVERTATGSVAVAAEGFTIPVATTVAADISAGTIAAGAARVGLRVIPWVGTAVLVADIAATVASHNIVVCPPPNFFCKPGPNTTGYYFTDSFYAYNSFSSIDVCTNYYKRSGSTGIVVVGDAVPNLLNKDGITGNYYCQISVNSGSVRNGQLISKYSCPPAGQAVPANSGCNGTSSTGGNTPSGQVPASQGDLQSAMNADYAQTQDMEKRMHDEQVAIEQANPDLPPPMDLTGTPTKITSPPVTAPPVVISKVTTPNADGSTSTTTSTKTITVSPQVGTPSTVDSPNITYPSSSTTTTTTVNNTTNVTNTTTTIVNNPPVVPSKPSLPNNPKPADLPTDYNREATQKLILQQLDGTLITGADPANQDTRVKTGTDATDKSLADKFTALPNELTSDKGNWFSWVWTPPVGQCDASMFSGVVRGYTITWDICPWVSKIRDAIGFLFALFGALNIYGNLFRKGEN